MADEPDRSDDRQVPSTAESQSEKARDDVQASEEQKRTSQKSPPQKRTAQKRTPRKRAQKRTPQRAPRTKGSRARPTRAESPDEVIAGIAKEMAAQPAAASLRRSPGLRALVIVVPLLLLLFLSVLAVQYVRTEELRAELASARAEAAGLADRVAFYRDAYRTTLEDARLLSRAYGEDERYARLAAELRAAELRELGLVEGALVPAPDPALWRRAVADGRILTSCLTPYELTTGTDTVLFSIWSDDGVQVYVDSAFLETVGPAGGVSVELSPGDHELMLVGSPERLMADTEEIPLELLTPAAGEGAALFGCEPSIAPVAYRLLIKKS